MPKVHWKAAIAACAVIASASLGAAPAYATAKDSTSKPSSSNSIGAYVKVSGEFIELDSMLAQNALHLKSSEAAETNPMSRLINWDQWFGCFSLNHENDVFALYTHWWNGAGKDIRLKCGAGNGQSGWGYKHIRDGHENDWQNKLNEARSKGWNSQEVGVESWDDLMSGAVATAISWPEYKSTNAVSKTSCGVTEIFFAKKNNPGQIVYSFRVRAAWANDSDRLITAFPQSTMTC